NSYNYDGIAFDGTGGVDPLDRIMAYHAKSQTWEIDTATPFSVMDLRDIAQINSNQYIIAGGMLPGQEVSNRTFLLTYTPHVISIINASCSYNCDGQAVVTGLSGVFPYSYQWDDPANQTNDTATGLCPGTYTVMVIDAVPDTVYAEVFIGPDTLTITATSTFNSCNGDTSKSITVSATGGISPYEYSSDGVNFQISSTLSGLAAGNYDIYVRDANNCRDTTFSVTITDPPALSGTLGSTDESFAGANDGTVWVNASGGIPPYSYLWMPGSMTGDSITGLSPDTFTVTVTDSNGCIFTGTDTVFSGPVGINELFNELNNVKLYPNPANKKLYVEGEDIVKVILYDLMGKIILVTQTNIRQWVSLDISTLKDGIYMLKVVGKNNVYTRKVQIQL
ncbi:MAG: T9SS type A sorting domain-containing protein, partial [Bacteroidetes bacterium]|nr:T9SS type A sorting domain-containing protein [Bacteroidota bacterium]